MSSHRMGIVWAIVFVGAFASAATGQTSSFKVLVLDALNGKPQSGGIVRYFCAGLGWNSKDEVRTGPDGIAEVPYQCREGTEQFEVGVPGGVKGECGEVGSLKLSDILSKGIISEPERAGDYFWCPTLQRSKLKPIPGQVTVFVFWISYRGN
jgi:hypothetical protein